MIDEFLLLKTISHEFKCVVRNRKSIIPITETEVAHDGIASVIHSIVAKAKMAITRR